MKKHFRFFDDHSERINLNLLSEVKESGLKRSQNFDNLTSIIIKMMENSKMKVNVSVVDLIRRNIITIILSIIGLTLFGMIFLSLKSIKSELKEIRNHAARNGTTIDSLTSQILITKSQIQSRTEILAVQSVEKKVSNENTPGSPKTRDKTKETVPSKSKVVEKKQGIPRLKDQENVKTKPKDPNSVPDSKQANTPPDAKGVKPVIDTSKQ
ncbi:MAG: hypothetical protein IPJ09_09270 [Saprospiraceae bacterium]|nr:hypothetical protein [Saprospiraceae bacterium]